MILVTTKFQLYMSILPLACGALFKEPIRVVTAFNTDAISARRGLKIQIPKWLETFWSAKQWWCRGQKFHFSTHYYKWNLERRSNSSQSMDKCLEKNYLRMSYYILLPCILHCVCFKAQVHVFGGRVEIVSHLSCRKSAIVKYFCPLWWQKSTDEQENLQRLLPTF